MRNWFSFKNFCSPFPMQCPSTFLFFFASPPSTRTNEQQQQQKQWIIFWRWSVWMWIIYKFSINMCSPFINCHSFQKWHSFSPCVLNYKDRVFCSFCVSTQIHLHNSLNVFYSYFFVLFVRLSEWKNYTDWRYSNRKTTKSPDPKYRSTIDIGEESFVMEIIWTTFNELIIYSNQSTIAFVIRENWVIPILFDWIFKKNIKNCASDFSEWMYSNNKIGMRGAKK